jgi:glutathione synthase
MSSFNSNSSSSEVNQFTEDELMERIHWALSNGIIMALNTKDNELIKKYPVMHIPFTMQPFKIPLTAFIKAQQVATLFNIVIDKISRNPEWLVKTLQHTAKNDPFTGRLLDIYKIIESEGGPKQKFSLGIIRSDYMQHETAGDPRTLLQVEVNTIASSFGGLSTKISEMHKSFEPDKNIPINAAVEGIAKSIANAHYEYIRQMKDIITKVPQIIMVIQPNERNFADQRMLHFELIKKYNNKIPLIRATLTEIYDNSVLDETTGVLLYHDTPVSLFYFRAGYSPDDHPTQKEWDCRLLIERSISIKSPNIGYHLAGCKKVQQVLANPGVLEVFLSNTSDIASLQEVFAGLYNLDVTEHGENSKQQVHGIIQKAILKPNDYVLKPQREGGGNNIYGANVCSTLQDLNEEEISAYILMERILPSSQDSFLVRNGNIIKVNFI